jgi:dipeptidyl aminopeptidase/acylaminoacyl peptidase
MSELVRMMARLMLAVLAGCAALTVGVWAAGRGQGPGEVLAYIPESSWDAGTQKTQFNLIDTRRNLEGTYFVFPFFVNSFMSSNDGRLVVATNGQIYLLDQTRSLRKISQFFYDVIDFSWSSDGRLALSLFRNGHAELEILELNQVLRQIAAPASEAPYIFSWSPDGQLAFSPRFGPDMGIYVLDRENHINYVDQRNTQFAWAPDSRLAFVSNRYGDSEIYVRERNGDLHNVSNNPADDKYPSWSPNGKLAYISSTIDGKQTLHILDQNERPFRIYNLIGYYGMSWSADDQLAFVTADEGANFHLYIVDQNGELHLIPVDAVPNPPRWSLNGQLAFNCILADSRSEVCVMSHNPAFKRVHVDSYGNAIWSSDEQLAYPLLKGYDNDGAALFDIGVLERDGKTHVFSIGESLWYGWLTFPFN